MAASDKFKQQLKAGKIVEALSTALSEAIELEITTWVSSADVDDRTSEEQPKPGSRMQTRINIVEGDITNEIGDRFLNNGPYSELRQFHLEQVQQSREIINDNLKSLQKLFGMLVRVGYQNPNAAPIPPELSGVDSPRLPPDETAASSVTIEPEVSLVEESATDAIAFDPRVEIDTVSDTAPIPPPITPDFLPPATPETPVEPAVSADVEESATDAIAFDPRVEIDTVSDTAPIPPPVTPDFLPPATPETPVEPVVSAQEWEEAVMQEPPFEPGWTPEFGSAVNWGTEEEWEEVEVEEEPLHRFSGGFAPVEEDEDWNENDDGWEEDEEPPTMPDISSNSDRISDPIAVLFGDTPVEPPQSSPPMSENTRSPVNIEEALFSETPPKPSDESEEDEDEFGNPSPPPPSK
ncbi:hypothetical protein [Coleofasciculus sp. H7-2]|uniref:hypothetical protein n=1 Tax=Coleofasciculus sp. H7-2 TaxID=3351545 RepID=UPI003672175B